MNANSVYKQLSRREKKREREYIGNRFNITSLNEWKIYL